VTAKRKPGQPIIPPLTPGPVIPFPDRPIGSPNDYVDTSYDPNAETGVEADTKRKINYEGSNQ